MKEKAVDTRRVLVYCQSLNMCADLYGPFNYELGEASYHPPGSPHLSDYWLFRMFHACTLQYSKNVILKSLAVRDGVVHVVFATIALGKGVDLKEVNTVIRYGATPERGRLFPGEW